MKSSCIWRLMSLFLLGAIYVNFNGDRAFAAAAGDKADWKVKWERTVKAAEKELVAAGPDIVWVALGSPKQEFLIAALRDSLPGAWMLGVGISLSFISGMVPRAPVWMQRSGLEFLHRLLQEPGRLARRYLIDDLPYAAGLLVRSWWNRERT